MHTHNTLKMNIPPSIQKVLDVLYSSGYEGYLVGGCVRDAMMGIEPHDFDLTTNATPDEMLDIFKEYRIIETGLKHGTVTVVSDGENVEITTYRIDGEYLDNRRPSEVSFTRNLNEDLSRRDFTVNALAYSPRDGLVDVFDGVPDIEHKVIRCVGDADKRFNEDGLRIMRALRFSSVLDFDIDASTQNSIHSNKHLLKNISAERIYTELKKLVCGVRASDIIVRYIDVFSEIFPQIYERIDDFCSNAAKINMLDCSYINRLGGLLFGFDTLSVRGFMQCLKPDNYSIQTVSALCEESQKILNTDDISIRYLMSAHNDEFIMALADIKKIYCYDFDYDKFVSLYNIQKNLNPCVSIKQLAVTGSDLIKAGIKQGPQIGEIMNTILCAVIENKCQNTKDDIFSYIFRGES